MNIYTSRDVFAEPSLTAASGAILGGLLGLILGPEGAIGGAIAGAALGRQREQEELAQVEAFNRGEG